MNNFNNNYNNQNQGGNQGGSRSSVSHAKIQVIGNITKDPTSRAIGNNGAKVASTDIAINHKGQNNDNTDFWVIEVWVNQGQSSAVHDFLVDYCKTGRQLFVEGIPQLKRRKRQNNGQDVLDQNGKAVYDYYPTIRVTSVVGLAGGGNSNGNNSNNGGQQQQQQQGGQQNGFVPQGNFGGMPQQQAPQQQQQNVGQGAFSAPQQGAPQGAFGAPQQGAPQQGAPQQGGPGAFGPPTGQFTPHQ